MSSRRHPPSAYVPPGPWRSKTDRRWEQTRLAQARAMFPPKVDGPGEPAANAWIDRHFDTRQGCLPF